MKTLENIISLCRGKNVLLVGNNDIINKQNNGSKIDSYDIVVRMNHAIPNENMGFKTDIWLCSFNNKNKQMKEFLLFNPKIIIRLNEDGNINEQLKEHFYIWPWKEHEKCAKELGALPSTGIMAIYFFVNYIKPESVSIIGMDNFSTKSYYNNKKIAHKYHDINKEKEFTKQYINEGKLNEI